MRDLRRVVVVCVVGSFGVSALLGILALLGGGDFGPTQVSVLLSTVIVGFESLTVLCYLTLAGHRAVGVGVLGALVSLICSGTALWWVWNVGDVADEPWRLFSSTLVLALTLAQASLLIRVADREGHRVGLGITLGLAAVVAALLIGPILQEELAHGDGYWRVFGILAILDVLGTIVLMATAAAGTRRTSDTTPPSRPPLLGDDTERRIADLARSRETTPDAVVTEALDALSQPRRPLQQ